MSAGQNEEVETARAKAVMADEQSRIDASEFDLGITITDADGKPLDDVVPFFRHQNPTPRRI